MDVQMPNMDGFETARLIRQREKSRDTPIIFITAYDRDDADVLAAYELGAVDFLFKPMMPGVLRGKVSVFVTLRQHQRREQQRQIVEERQQWEAEAMLRRMEEERANTQALAHALEEKGRMSEQLAATNRRLALADRAKDEFLAMLGHELRNPLTPLVTGLELLKAHSATNPGSERIREIMQRQVQQLRRLVDDLLDIARITSGRIELKTEDVDLRIVLAEALDPWRPSLGERTLDLILPDQPVFVRGDPARINQIIVNLVQNASRFTAPTGRITVRLRRDDGGAILSVSDDGAGVPADLAERIFEMYVQEKPTKDGLGLGLAVVQRLVALHGGSISLESDVEHRGTTFRMRFPVIDAPRMSVVDEQPAPRRNGKRQLRVVVIEDNQDNREMLSELIAAGGHEVLSAPDGKSGIDLLLKAQPDAAVVDIGLPDLSGFDVARQVRLSQSAVRMVALTGFGQDKDKEQALAAGFDAHMTKPPNLEALMRFLETT
jgi:signal transduction histidine kinase